MVKTDKRGESGSRNILGLIRFYSVWCLEEEWSKEKGVNSVKRLRNIKIKAEEYPLDLANTNRNYWHPEGR